MPDDPADRDTPRALFLLGFDDAPDPWFLDDPVPSIDSWSFQSGSVHGSHRSLRTTSNASRCTSTGGRALRALHVLSRIDAVDRERTKAYAYRPGAAVGEHGTVASRRRSSAKTASTGASWRAT